MNRKHLIFSDISGHRAHWLKELDNSILESEKISLHFPKSAKSIVEKTILEMSFSKLQINLIFHDSTDYIGSVLREASPDDLIIDWDADRRLFSYVFCLRKLRLLVMRPYLQEFSFKSLVRFLLKILIIFLIANCRHKQIYLLAIPGHRPRILKKHWVNDFAPSSDSRHSQLTRSDQDFGYLLGELPENYFFVPGFITSRKNPILILESVRRLNAKVGMEFKVVFAGIVELSVLDSISRFSEAHIINRSLSEYELDYLIDESIALLLMYDNVSSSGLTLRCISRQKMVILPSQKYWNSLSATHGQLFQTAEIKVESLSKLLTHLYPFKFETINVSMAEILNQKECVMKVLL
jgi:hypothetical protein